MNTIIDKYDLLNIALLPNRKNYKVNYVGKSGHKNIVIETLAMKIPYGVEKYNYNQILNIEFSDIKKNDMMYNKYIIFSTVDSFFSKLTYNKKLQRKFGVCLYNKSYIPSIRTSRLSSLLRTYIKKNTVFCDKDGVSINKKDIKSKSGIFILKLD